MPSHLMLWLMPAVFLPVVTCDLYNASHHEPESRLEERRIAFAESSVPDNECQVSCTQDSDCNGRNRVCDESRKYCVCAKGYSLTVKWCQGERVIEFKCERDRGEKWAPCDRDKDCVDRLTCISAATVPHSKSCQPAGVRLGEQCVDGGQCTTNAVCQGLHGVDLRCRCSPTYTRAEGRCVKEEDSDDSSAMQVYRITLIFASCCLALVLVMFVGCIVRRTYWPRPSAAERRRRRHRRPSSSSTQIAATEASIGAGIPFNVRPPYEKPPSYEESQRTMINLMGSPPPDYPAQLSVPTAFPLVHVHDASGNSSHAVTGHMDCNANGGSREELVVAGTSCGSSQTASSSIGLANQAFQPD